MKAPTMSLLLPILAALFIIVWGGGLGVIFILLSETGLGEWGSIIIGMSLVVLVPFFAAVLAMPRR